MDPPVQNRMKAVRAMILLYILGAMGGLLLCYVLLLCLAGLFVDPRREYDTYSPFYRFLLSSATALAVRLVRIRVHVTGLEKLPRDKKLLFVCNHRSNYDPIVTWYALKPWRLAFVSKPENFKIPIFGRLIRRCCFLPIDRENPRNAIVTIQRAAQLLEKQTVSVGVYPEGTRSKTGQLLPFHNGVFKIAQRSGASVAVLSILGTEKIAKRTPFRPTHVYLDILEVFDGETLKGTKTEMLGAAARRSIECSIEKRCT